MEEYPFRKCGMRLQALSLRVCSVKVTWGGSTAKGYTSKHLGPLRHSSGAASTNAASLFMRVPKVAAFECRTHALCSTEEMNQQNPLPWRHHMVEGSRQLCTKLQNDRSGG